MRAAPGHDGGIDQAEHGIMTESGTALENPGTGPESYYSTEKADAKRRARLLLYFYGKVWNVGFDHKARVVELAQAGMK